MKHQRKELNSSYIKSINDIKNQEIVDAVKRAEQQAKMAVNDLGMADLLKKYKKWDSATQAGLNDLSSQVCDDDLEEDVDDTENEEMLTEADNKNLIREMYTDEEQQIGQDVEIITENKLVGNSLLEKLKKFKRKFKRVTSESIPCTKKKKQNCKQESRLPFSFLHLGRFLYMTKQSVSRKLP